MYSITRFCADFNVLRKDFFNLTAKKSSEACPGKVHLKFTFKPKLEPLTMIRRREAYFFAVLIYSSYGDIDSAFF